MEKEKIVFDYEFARNDYAPYDSMGRLTFVYGMPTIKDGKVDIVQYGKEAIEIRSNRLQNTLGQFIVNFLEQKYPNALILSKADYAFSMNLGVEPINKLSRKWKREFRRYAIKRFLARLKGNIVADKFRYVFCHRKYMKEMRDKRIDYYFNPFRFYHSFYDYTDKDNRRIIAK